MLNRKNVEERIKHLIEQTEMVEKMKLDLEDPEKAEDPNFMLECLDKVKTSIEETAKRVRQHELEKGLPNEDPNCFSNSQE